MHPKRQHILKPCIFLVFCASLLDDARDRKCWIPGNFICVSSPCLRWGCATSGVISCWCVAHSSPEPAAALWNTPAKVSSDIYVYGPLDAADVGSKFHGTMSLTANLWSYYILPPYDLWSRSQAVPLVGSRLWRRPLHIHGLGLACNRKWRLRYLQTTDDLAFSLISNWQCPLVSAEHYLRSVSFSSFIRNCWKSNCINARPSFVHFLALAYLSTTAIWTLPVDKGTDATHAFSPTWQKFWQASYTYPSTNVLLANRMQCSHSTSLTTLGMGTLLLTSPSLPLNICKSCQRASKQTFHSLLFINMDTM